MSGGHRRKVVVLRHRGSKGRISFEVSAYPTVGQTILVPRDALAYGRMAHYRGLSRKLLAVAPSPPAEHGLEFRAFYI